MTKPIMCVRNAASYLEYRAINGGIRVSIVPDGATMRRGVIDGMKALLGMGTSGLLSITLLAVGAPYYIASWRLVR